MNENLRIEKSLKRYRALREANPDLLNEDLNAILIAASNDGVAQAIRCLQASVDMSGANPLQSF